MINFKSKATAMKTMHHIVAAERIASDAVDLSMTDIQIESQTATLFWQAISARRCEHS